MQGYLAEPHQAAGAPAIVVIQEWWGFNDQIRGVADRLAQCRLPRAGARPVPRQVHASRRRRRTT